MLSYIQLTLHFLLQKDQKDQPFCAFNDGMKCLNSGLGEDILRSLYNYLMTSREEGSEVLGAASRNQYNVINFGYQTLNCTDTENEEVYNLPMPKITKRFDDIRGLVPNDSNMRDSLINTMVTLTKLMDSMTAYVNIAPFMNCENRKDMFAKKIHPKNKLEGISVNTSISCSSCHQDQHNGREGTYAWTISCYAYIETNKVGLTSKDVR